MVRLLYFAWMRERIGTGEEERALPPGTDRVDLLMAHLRGVSPAHEAAFARPEMVRCAVNQTMARHDTPVGDGDEVAFFPPITGG